MNSYSLSIQGLKQERNWLLPFNTLKIPQKRQTSIEGNFSIIIESIQLEYYSG